MTPPGKVARALALCTLVFLLASSCSFLPAPSPPVDVPKAAPEETNERVEQIAYETILILRRLNINNLAFVRDALPPRKYRVALQFLIPDIQAVSQQVIDLNAGNSDLLARGLLEAVDPLTRAARDFHRYVDTGQDDALATAYVHLDQAWLSLEEFLASLALAGGPALRESLADSGRIEIATESTTVSRVVLGPFVNLEEARNVQAAARTYDAEIRGDESPTVWLGPFRAVAEAQAVAAHWRERDVAAAVHEGEVYEFRASEISPVQGKTWREMAWHEELQLQADFVAVSPEGGVVLAGNTSGTVQRRSGRGDHQWTLDFSLPTYALAVTREGDGTFAVGIGAQSLDGQGGVRWRDSLAEYDVVLESAAISSSGEFMVAATSNVSGTGQALGFSQSGVAWVTPKPLGVNSFSLASDGSLVALGAVGEERYHVIVLNERGEKVMGSDLIEPVVSVALANHNQKLVVLSERHVSQFDIATEKIEWQAMVRGRALAVSQPGDIIYVGGVHGITAFLDDGRQYWTQDAMPVSQIVANRDYLIGLSDNIRLVVVRFDGSILGTVSPLVPIREFAVATDGSILVVLDEDNRLSAWQLPPPTE